MTYLNVFKPWTCQMPDMKSSNGWTLMLLHSFNGWPQIVQLPVFKQIRLIRQPYQNCVEQNVLFLETRKEKYN